MSENTKPTENNSPKRKVKDALFLIGYFFIFVGGSCFFSILSMSIPVFGWFIAIVDILIGIVIFLVITYFTIRGWLNAE